MLHQLHAESSVCMLADSRVLGSTAVAWPSPETRDFLKGANDLFSILTRAWDICLEIWLHCHAACVCIGDLGLILRP